MVCLQSMKKSLSRPEARTTRLRSNERSRSSSTRRSRGVAHRAPLRSQRRLGALADSRDHRRRRPAVLALPRGLWLALAAWRGPPLLRARRGSVRGGGRLGVRARRAATRARAAGRRCRTRARRGRGRGRRRGFGYRHASGLTVRAGAAAAGRPARLPVRRTRMRRPRAGRRSTRCRAPARRGGCRCCGAPRSPTTRAPASSTMDSVAETLPATAPCTMTRRPLTSLLMSAPSPMASSPLTRHAALDAAEDLEVALAAHAAAHERAAADRRYACSTGTLHVHVDVALERGPVRDGEPRRLDVADEAPAGEQVDAIGRGDVARHADRRPRATPRPRRPRRRRRASMVTGPSTESLPRTVPATTTSSSEVISPSIVIPCPMMVPATFFVLLVCLCS